MMLNKPFYAIICAAAVMLSAQSCDNRGNSFIFGIQSSTPIVPNVTSSATKVPAITTGRLEASPYGVFVMDAWSDADYIDHAISETSPQTDHHIINSVDVTYDSASSETYKWSLNEEKCWINNIGIRFWCYAPKTVNGTRTITSQSGGRSDMTFSYTLPAGGYSVDGKDADATRQDDLLFSYNNEKRQFNDAGSITSSPYGSRDDNRLDITFEHALSQVNFAICVEDGSFNLNLVSDILVISLSNVASSATCTYDGASSGAHFVWSDPSATSTYTQDYTLDNLGYYSKTEAGSVTIDGTPKTFPNIDDMRSIQQSFMMIPHTLGEFAAISATFKYIDTDGNPTTTTRSVPLSGDVWEPGKYYTYRILASTIGRDIKIDVTLADWGDANESIIV